MPTGGSNLKCTFNSFLALKIFEIDIIFIVRVMCSALLNCHEKVK